MADLGLKQPKLGLNMVKTVQDCKGGREKRAYS